ncbi:tetratricopeptide repeat protein [Xanthomonas sp. XNM01]|uniref:tetratricopeptide repeat protein n=1 Tax=Xanthomonas sp. XNM01 TaxID=2769289 RepID=UPI001CE1EDDF|nr:tetratricopeptide repeat protein [Xanthomonas sp. XNM01]
MASPRDDVMTPLLAGEFALQAGQLPDAARWYLEAARGAEADEALADRATRIAMLANDDKAAAEALALWRARAPESLPMHAASASLALRRGQARQARRELEGLLRSSDPRGWRYALVALSGGRDQKTTTRVLGQLVDSGAIPDELPAWQEFGRLALRLEEQPLAKRIVDQVVVRFPDEPRVAVLRAGQLQQSGRPEEARAMLAQVEPRAADDGEIRAMLAIAYESMRDFGAVARVMAMGPQDTQTYGARASALARGEDTGGLTALYDQLVAEGAQPDPGRRLLLGRLAEFLKRPTEALDWYRGVPGGPQRIEARIRIAAVLHALERREEAYTEARALQNDGTADDDARRDAYLLEAELRHSADDDAGELDALGRGLAAYPDDNALLYARALAWERRDRIDRAEADLRKVLVTEPENVAALNALGYTLADRTTRYQEALELIDRARTAEPDNPAIVDSYGWVLYRLGRHAQALVELRRAWSLMKDPEVAAHVGEVLWVTGRREEARRFFDEALKLDPENRSLRRALETLGVEVAP